MTDTLFADVSEYQVPVNNSYPYRVLSIRVCDGTYRDRNFAHNYRWMRSAFDSGRLTFGIVYTYARPNWWANANTVRSMIDAAGGLHPRVALMLDVESGGNPPGDGSSWINRLYWNLADYAGSPVRTSVMPTPTTSSTCGVFARRACASLARVMVPIRTFPDKWRTSTPTAVGIAPIFHRALHRSVDAI